MDNMYISLDTINFIEKASVVDLSLPYQFAIVLLTRVERQFRVLLFTTAPRAKRHRSYLQKILTYASCYATYANQNFLTRISSLLHCVQSCLCSACRTQNTFSSRDKTK